jgi:hypothetical protein
MAAVMMNYSVRPVLRMFFWPLCLFWLLSPVSLISIEIRLQAHPVKLFAAAMYPMRFLEPA